MFTSVKLQAATALEFRSAARVQRSLTAKIERKMLRWLASRTPERIGPDHLTALGFAAQFFAGAAYAMARWNKYALLLAIVFISVNWLGDSLDGTLARHRERLRPRYGFYVDHMVDTFGSTFLVAGLAISKYIHWQIAVAMLVAFLVLSVETYLASYTLHEFRLSHGIFGPTELRILLVIGTITLLFHPRAIIFGRSFLLLDVGGATATIGMLAMALAATVRHTMRLYAEERLH
jgi:phosphatidylglycerophosphate synthase